MTPPPRDWTRPRPSVTCSVWPAAWRCQALRAPGAKRTTLTRMREGSSPLAMTSYQASPVNVSAGALTVGRLARISMVSSLSMCGGLSRPAGEEVQRVLGRGAGFGAVRVQPQTRVRGELQRLVRQREVADDRVTQVLDPGAVEAHVVRGPPGTERLAARGQLRSRRV